MDKLMLPEEQKNQCHKKIEKNQLPSSANGRRMIFAGV
jgi:hypothetical protein